MTRTFKTVLTIAGALTALALGNSAAADHERHGQGHRTITLFDGKAQNGRAVTIEGRLERLGAVQFNDRARSAYFDNDSRGWLLCKHADFEGPCLVARRSIRDLKRFAMDDEITSVRPLGRRNDMPHGTIFKKNYYGEIVFYEASFGSLVEIDPYADQYYGHNDRYGHDPYGHRGGYHDPYARNGYRHDPYEYRPKWSKKDYKRADVILFEHSYFKGNSMPVGRDFSQLGQYGFGDKTSSIQIRSGRWEVCEHANYRGRCRVIDASREGVKNIQMNDNISSIRRVGPGYRPNAGVKQQFGEKNFRSDKPVEFHRKAYKNQPKPLAGGYNQRRERDDDDWEDRFERDNDDRRERRNERRFRDDLMGADGFKDNRMRTSEDRPKKSKAERKAERQAAKQKRQNKADRKAQKKAKQAQKAWNMEEARKAAQAYNNNPQNFRYPDQNHKAEANKPVAKTPPKREERKGKLPPGLRKYDF